MTGETTSLPARETARAEWNSFFAFVRAPSLPDQPVQGWKAGLVAIPRVLALDLAAMSVLIALAGIVMLIGVDLPETALSGVKIDLPIVMMVVLAAPLLEELAFRGWLSGRPGHVAALLIVLGGGIVAAMFAAGNTGETATTTVRFAMIGCFTLAAATLVVLRNCPPMRWFAAIFPLLYWLSVIAFAAVHLLNFEEAGAAILPLVLPQFLLGMLLGYLRVTYGLWSSILLHMLHNGLIISIVLMATSGGGS